MHTLAISKVYPGSAGGILPAVELGLPGAAQAFASGPGVSDLPPEARVKHIAGG